MNGSPDALGDVGDHMILTGLQYLQPGTTSQVHPIPSNLRTQPWLVLLLLTHTSAFFFLPPSFGSPSSSSAQFAICAEGPSLNSFQIRVVYVGAHYASLLYHTVRMCPQSLGPLSKRSGVRASPLSSHGVTVAV